jgi:hypothetical protein
VIYFVTICVEDRQCVLANAAAFDAFKTAASKLQHWRVVAAVMMPDHLHAFAAPTRDRGARLGNFSGALKRWMREELNASWDFHLAVSIDCCGPMSRCTKNGSTSEKIPSVPGKLNIGRIGRTKLASTTFDCRATASVALLPGKRSACPTAVDDGTVAGNAS